MLYAYVRKFDVTGTAQTFLGTKRSHNQVTKRTYAAMLAIPKRQLLHQHVVHCVTMECGRLGTV